MYNFINSPPYRYKHMHKEEVTHIAMVNEESLDYPLYHPIDSFTTTRSEILWIPNVSL